MKGEGIRYITEVTQMPVYELWRDKQPAALDRRGYQFDYVRWPGAGAQPRLRRGIAKVEVHPDEVRAARGGIGRRVVAQRLPQ